MKQGYFSRGRVSARSCLVSWLSGLLLLGLLVVQGTRVPQTTMAANTVEWREVDPPASSGWFVVEVCGDINEDGHLDLIGAAAAQGIWVAAGNGDGTWTALGPVEDFGSYYGLALGDVNNDGKLDLVGAEEGSGVHIWTGDGKGGWATMTSPVGSGKIWSVALGDVNNDGKLDIAAGSGENAGLRVWTGDGAGGWTLASTSLPTTGYYTNLALGDVDRDGRPDLVATGQGTGVQAWRGSGGAFWTERSSGLPASGNYYGLALGDLDHDGDLDIVSGGDGMGLRAWTGSGGVIWAWIEASTGLPTSGGYWAVRVGDVDNDGNLDIAATSPANPSSVWVWVGDGGGAWSEASTGLPASGNYYGLTLGDWNDDGMLDLSAGHTAGAQAWADGGIPDVPEGWIQIASPTTAGYYQGLDVGDWNHDAKLDVVAAGEGSGIQLWEGDGGNTWDEIADWTNPDLPTSGTYRGLAFGDIDHNGWLDVVLGSGEDAGLHAWLFMDEVAWIEYSGELPVTGTYLDVALGDFSNDGYVDIAAVGTDLGVRAWRAEDFDNIPHGWWRRRDSGMPDTGTYLSVAYGDLNDDGKLDIVAASAGGGLGVWQGDGTGIWTEMPSPTDSDTWQGVAVGDINDDAMLDVVAASDSLGVRVWAGDGAYGWTALAEPAASGNYAHVALGDLNNDGKLDIAAGTVKETGLEVWTGDGGSSWTPYSLNLPTTGAYPDVAFGEVDNDGFLDLVGARYGEGSVHVWTGGEGAPPSGWDGFAPTGWISTSQKVDCSVQVQDTGSGLRVESAAYSYYGSSGTWSGWEKAGCTGSDGTTEPQTITAVEVPFDQDSGPHPLYEGNWIKFRIEDVTGNVGYSDPYLVTIDTTPPNNPTSFPDSSHWPGGPCRNDDTIWVDWDGASDATSGLDGYSYVFRTAYELPDTVVDTWLSEVTSDPLADGWWTLYIRTRDEAGNWAPEAAFEGPFCVDTGPPTNPTGFDSSHDVEVWSTDNTIYAEWWGATDPGGEVYGYSVAWTRSASSTPDETVDTTDTHTTSPALDDDDRWYFHVRSRDRAGNWASGAAHWGPFYIDRTDPTAMMNVAHEVTVNPFPVGWTGWDDMSGLASYDVQRSPNGSTWYNWAMGTADTSRDYVGERGGTYYFRVRARDNAGNVSAWTAAFDVTVGEDTTVRVQDEDGANRSGAEVYRNGEYLGTTGAGGTLIAEDTLFGDELAAILLIETHEAVKDHHGWGGTTNWSYRTYITSVDIPNVGDPELHQVMSTGIEQVLTLRRQNALVGFHPLVVVEWDADPNFLQEVLRGWEIAADYLYDVTDGHMFLEAIEILDNGHDWADADYRIYASNTVWPNARTTGIWQGSGAHVHLPRVFSRDGSWHWDQNDAARTAIHEWGHYGLGLKDEYEDRDSDDPSYCSTNFDTEPSNATRSCFMNWEQTTTEMCSDLASDPHRWDTEQDAWNHGSCWDTVVDNYDDDTGSPDRWTLRTPVDRGQKVAGPTALAVAGWLDSTILNYSTGVCPPFGLFFTHADPTVPLTGTTVWVDRAGSDLNQGRTDVTGYIEILGAHDGETVRATYDDASSGSRAVSCPPRAATTAPQVETVVLTPNPFTLAIAVHPQAEDAVQVQVRPSTELSAPPAVSVWQAGAEQGITPTMAYDEGLGAWVGTAQLDAGLGYQGQVETSATAGGDTLYYLTPFNIEPVAAAELTELYSGDGFLELTLQPGSLPADTLLSITPGSTGSREQDGLERISAAYDIVVASGVYSLAYPAVVNIRFDLMQAEGILTDTLQIYHWDPGTERWVSDGGTVDHQQRWVSARVDHLSTYALLGQRAGRKQIYLPLVVRDF